MTAPEPTADVLVTVVVIVYNDAARLPAAVASALEQQLPLEVVVVDDASTDATADVCARLATDHRVRIVRRATNSGGCSAPRNDGIDVARGQWVVFLDSDDVLPSGAVAALVGAGERTGADLVSGLCQRVYLDSGAVRPWCPQLYAKPRLLTGLQDEPGLWWDTLSTNKAYRLDFLREHALRFPLGIHFEDVVFSAQAYLAAGSIALVPDVVYRWNVAAEDSGELSISRRRHNLDNLADRVRAHRLVDQALAASRPNDDKLRAAKDRKFVEADLRLYLDDLWLRDEDYRLGFLRVLQPYLAGIPATSWERLAPLPGLAAGGVRDGDLDLAQDANERLRRSDRRRLPWLARLDTLDERRTRLTVALSPDPLATVAAPPPSALSAELVPTVAGLTLPRGRRRLGVTPVAGTAGPWELEVSPPPASFGAGVVAWRVVVSGQGVPRQAVARPYRWQETWTEGESPDGHGWRWQVSRGGDVQLGTERALRLQRRVDGWRRRWRWTPVGQVALRLVRRRS